MISSRVLLSRILPTAEGDVSFYDSFRREPPRRMDPEHQRAGTMNEPFHDDDDDPEQFLFDNPEESPAVRNTSVLSPQTQPSSIGSPLAHNSRPRWQDTKGIRHPEEEEDVPESLLLDPRDKSASRGGGPSIGPMGGNRQAQWRAAQEQHGIHASRPPRSSRPGSGRSRQTSHQYPTTGQPDPKAYATWLYTNAHNLDAFLLDIYEYFVEHGVHSIILSRVLGLMTELFVFSFAMFLTTCIDYSKVPSSKSTKEVLIPKCMGQASFLKKAALFFFIIWWLSRLAHYLRDSRRLYRMHDFFLHVLGISDDDIQTVSWVRVVNGLVKVQNANVATANNAPSAKKYLDYKEPQQRLSAESIANRLMRKANYYVALYNKDILDFTLPLPFVGTRQFYSKSLEWNIDFCLTNFIFDDQGNIRPFCLEVRNRSALVATLRTRLRFTALISVIIAPFNIIRFCIVYFFRYYTEFSRNPSRASARSFTSFAEWKIREFNELDHLFQYRLRQSYPFANDYLKQFPKDKTDQLFRFVAFVSGAFAAVLTLATLFDSELFLGFEITPGRTAFFWLTVMIGIFGVAQGSLPDESEVHDPVLHLKEVLMFTHYMPAHWKNRLHSNEVRSEFSAMYQMKVVIFFEEMLSIIIVPWILWRNSGKRSERIIDFFREQTVHVEGVGYQCNFAVFGFKKDPNAEDPSTAMINEPDGLRDDYFGLKDDKMAASVQNFMQYYSHYNRRNGAGRTARLQNQQQQGGGGGWQPPPSWPPVLGTSIAGGGAGGATGGAGASSGNNAPRNVAEVAFQQHSPRFARSALLSNNRNPAGGSSSNNARKNLLSSQHHPPPLPGSGTGIGTSMMQNTVTESRLMAQDSDLKEFADVARPNSHSTAADGAAEFLESDTGDEEDGEDDGVKNAGVLGMLYQFSQARKEKAGGVGGI